MTLATNLTQGLQALQLDLSSAIQTQLLDYLNLLTKWNRVYNLTAVRDVTQMLPKHILDSLVVIPYVCGTQILDVGTGAGLPGLMLAIARPDWQCVLLDSNGKKIRFVTQAIIELKLKNVLAVRTRIEQFNPPTEKFTTIIARAYTNLSQFYQQNQQFVATDGCLLAMKGVYPKAELEQISQLPISIECLPLHVPQLEAQRHLVVMRP